MDIVTNAVGIMMSGGGSKSSSIVQTILDNSDVIYTHVIDEEKEWYIKFHSVRPSYENGGCTFTLGSDYLPAEQGGYYHSDVYYPILWHHNVPVVIYNRGSAWKNEYLEKDGDYYNTRQMETLQPSTATAAVRTTSNSYSVDVNIDKSYLQQWIRVADGVVTYEITGTNAAYLNAFFYANELRTGYLSPLSESQIVTELNEFKNYCI